MDAARRPTRRGLFGRHADRASGAPTAAAGGRPGFEYLSADEVYLDSACQTLRPQPVIDAVQDYYQRLYACGGRVRYDAGRRVDAEVARVRERVLATLGCLLATTRAPSH